MRTTLSIATVGAALLLSATSYAHELACEKTVNGEHYIEVSQYPAQVTYTADVYNTDARQKSDVMSVEDPLLFNDGFRYTCGPFTLPVSGYTERQFTETLFDEQDCLAFSSADGLSDVYVDNTVYAVWDRGAAFCSARIKCLPQCDSPPCQTSSEASSQPTRTLGFYKVHPLALAQCLQTPLQLGALSLTTVPKALGLLWASPLVFSDGTPRTNLDRARLFVLREWLVASCNQRLFATAPTNATMFTDAASSMNATACKPMLQSEVALQEYNVSGESAAFPQNFDPGDAAPAAALAQAQDPTSKSGDVCADGTEGVP